MDIALFTKRPIFWKKSHFFPAVRAPPEPPSLPIRRCARDFACMCVGFWPACAHFFLVRRALWLGHACTLNGQCALFLFSVRAIFYFLCARFYWAMRAIFFGPCALFFFPCAQFISQIVIGFTGLCARFGCFQVPVARAVAPSLIRKLGGALGIGGRPTSILLHAKKAPKRKATAGKRRQAPRTAPHLPAAGRRRKVATAGHKCGCKAKPKRATAGRKRRH